MVLSPAQTELVNSVPSKLLSTFTQDQALLLLNEPALFLANLSTEQYSILINSDKQDAIEFLNLLAAACGDPVPNIIQNLIILITSAPPNIIETLSRSFGSL